MQYRLDIKVKVKEADLYSAFIEVPYTQGAQVRITQCYLQITPYLPRMPITRVELITISIVSIRSIWHHSAADFFAFWKISAENLRILWRHLPTEVRNV